jgi:hypothetical protein
MDNRERYGYEVALLERAAASVAYPATPELRGRVLAAMPHPLAPAPSARRGGERARRLAPAFVAAALLIAAGIGAALTVPSSRSAIAEFFGIEGSEVEILPTVAPGTTPTPFPRAPDLSLLARQVPVDELDAQAGFPVARPAGAGEPQTAFIARYGPQTVAILRYPGFDLWQAHLPTQFIAEKGVPAGLRVEEFEIAPGVPARWISGGAHVLGFEIDGATIDASVHTVERSTLIWRTENAFYRIETDLPFAEARLIAASLP